MSDTFVDKHGVFQQLKNAPDISIKVFDDPIIDGVSCYLGVVETGSAFVGIEVGSIVYSIALDCAKGVSLDVPESVIAGKRDGEEVYQYFTTSTRHSIVVNRYYDNKRNNLVYVASNHKLSGESPLISISTIVLPN